MLQIGDGEADASRAEEIWITLFRAADMRVMRIIEDFNLGFCLGNVVKYVLRAEAKGCSLEDLRKASWYLRREIANREASK